MWTPLVGQERFKWIEEQYAKARARRRKVLALFFSGFIELFGFVYIVLPFVPIPAELRVTVVGVVLIVSIGSIYASMRFLDSISKLLPPVEDRVLHFLTPAIVNLKAYVTNPNGADQKASLKNLRKIADVLDNWETGNLKFVRDSTGIVVDEFRKNFKGRVIPAIKSGVKQTAQLVQIWLSQQVQRTLEMGELTESHLKGWNDYLDPKDPNIQPQFPYQEPKQSRRKWLRSKWFHIIFVVSVPVAPAITYSLAVSAQLASRDAAFGGAVAVFVAVIGAWVVIMTIGKQKVP
jgi:hypothetical protein